MRMTIRSRDAFLPGWGSGASIVLSCFPGRETKPSRRAAMCEMLPAREAQRLRIELLHTRHSGNPMKLPRRAFLNLAAGIAALPAASRIAYPQSRSTGQPPDPPVRPLAERLAAYADGLRYEDIDPATIERVKTHVIDTIGCGIGAFDEKPVGICRDVALAVGGNCDHYRHRSTYDARPCVFRQRCRFPLLRFQRHLYGTLFRPSQRSYLRHASRWRRLRGPAQGI